MAKRFQSSVAIGSGNDPWLLINASPDLAYQTEAFLQAKGSPASVRLTPFGEVYLTNADLDHSLGILLLREGDRLRVIAPDGVRASLTEGLRFDLVLNASCGIEWTTPRREWQPTALPRVEFRAVSFSNASPPRFSPTAPGCHGVGYLFRNRDSGRVAGFFPDVAEIDTRLFDALQTCDLLFFDGTFWQEGELEKLGVGKRTAREMGHLPIDESMKTLATLAAKGAQVFYLHINNTNPILDPRSNQRREIEGAGLRLAEDGMRIGI